MTESAAVGLQSPVLWHDIECGPYERDLPVWGRLADESHGPVLDIGCGTGRVALHLAREGHHVLGIDLEAVFVGELNRRALRDELPASAEVGDVRALDLGEARFGLAIGAMQLLQLLRTKAERLQSLRGIARHLRRGGRAAFAITDTSGAIPGSPVPLPDVREVDGWVYSSLPIELRRVEHGVVISRLRQTVSPQGSLSEARSEVVLGDLTAERLESEAGSCGLLASARISVPPTPDHVGSTIVVLEAG